MPRKKVNQGLPNFKEMDMLVFKRLIKYIFKSHKLQYLVLFITVFLSSVSGVIGNLLLRKLIDQGITPLLGVAHPVLTTLIHIISMMIIVYGVGIIATYLYNFTIVMISQSILKNVRDEMFTKMQKLPLKYFDRHTYGEVMSYYTNDTDTLSEMISRSIPQAIASIVTVTSSFIAMISLNIYLTLTVLFFVMIMLLVTAKIGRKCSQYFVDQQSTIAKVDGYIEEMLNGQKDIQVFTYESQAKKHFDLLNEELCQVSTKAHQYANILMPTLENIGNYEYVFIGLVGGILALKGIGGLTIGIIASFIGLSKSFLSPIIQISEQLNSIIMAMAGAGRIFNLMDQTPEEDQGTVRLVNILKDHNQVQEVPYNTGLWAWKNKDEYIPLKGHILFKDVDFGYLNDKEVLHHVSMYAKPGQKIAFVGATGAGKTTLINLLNRFYDIDQGQILYDGIDIKMIKKADLRKSLGMVLQDVYLFTGTIKDNIKYGSPSSKDEEVIAASRLANAHDFIMQLPKGYDTQIDGLGSNLSQGQRQLLSIARAALNNPPVMILDEATSNIDTRTEKIVQKGMDKLMAGRTVLVIAHRLSTIQNAQAILVMDHGKIIERGTHHDLMKAKGEYYQLYTGKTELN